MRSVALAGLVAALALTLAPPPATPQKPPVFGASAELVLIDLIATDSNGRRVTDLRPGEITVLEDGKPQRLELVRFVETGVQSDAPSATPTAPAAQAATPAAAAPAVSTSPLSLVVVVDLATMPLELLVPTREALASMARDRLEPGTRLMLVSLDRGLQVRLPFTDDVGRFLAAVEALKPTITSEESALSDLVDQVERICDGTAGADKNAAGVARAFVEDVRLGMTTTTEGIGALARYLAPIPGRKHVVYYSSGYPMQPQSIAASVVEALCGSGSAQGSGRSAMQAGPSEAHTALRVGAQLDSTGLLRALIDEANRSQVSVYTVDARGLVGDAVPGSQRVPSRLIRLGNAQQIQQRAVREPQEILYSIADGTGGTASINTNDMTRGMQAAARDASGYYLIGYAPPGGRKEGRFYPIELKVSRPGLNLRYRRGYEWVSEQKRSERALAAALRFPDLYAAEGLGIDPWLEAGKLNVAVMLPTNILAFHAEGGQYLNEIAVQALLRDEQGKTVGERYLFSKSIAMKLPGDRYADLRTRESVEIANQVPAPKKGRYQISVVARHSGGKLATATVDFEVP
ncbi:MAG: VWA domain-containing protein [Vicinamibacteria bacterium]